MIRGTVRMWDSARGFGFIAADGRRDVYFNRALVANVADLPGLRVGTEVEYEMKTMPDNRARAINVRVPEMSAARIAAARSFFEKV